MLVTHTSNRQKNPHIEIIQYKLNPSITWMKLNEVQSELTEHTTDKLVSRCSSRHTLHILAVENKIRIKTEEKKKIFAFVCV